MNRTELKQKIKENVYQNAFGEITGDNLQRVLLDMVDFSNKANDENFEKEEIVIVNPQGYYVPSGVKINDIGSNLTAGENIKIEDDTISAIGYKYNEDKNSLSIGSGEKIVTITNNDITEEIVVEGKTQAVGKNSFASGFNSIAYGEGSHAEGGGIPSGSIGMSGAIIPNVSFAYGEGSHAEGIGTFAYGEGSHAEGSGDTKIVNFEVNKMTQEIADVLINYLQFSGSLGLENTYYSTDESIMQGSGTIIGYNSSGFTGLFLYNNESQSIGNYIGYPTMSNSVTYNDETMFVFQYSGTIGIEDGQHISGLTSNSIAKGNYSHTEGSNTKAEGDISHAEGAYTTASGYCSHTEGSNTKAEGDISHAEGDGTKTEGNSSHAEGAYTKAYGYASHSEGSYTKAYGYASHSEGSGSIASGYASHAEGEGTIASNYGSHAEGTGTTASGSHSHAEGFSTTASGYASHAEGEGTVASGERSHAEGAETTASGYCSHTEGSNTKAEGDISHAEGDGTKAEGYISHAEGSWTTASGIASHTEGSGTIASGSCSHAEGYMTRAIGYASHAEGSGSIGTGYASHAGGYNSQSNGEQSFVHGYNCTVDTNGVNAHTIGIDNYVSNSGCIALGKGLTTHRDYCTYLGQYNKLLPGVWNDVIAVVGDGTDSSNKRNIVVIQSGNEPAVHCRGAFKNDATWINDFGEYFEWADGNPNNEDRVGYMVQLNENKIELAQSIDEFIGVISATAGFIGGACSLDWHGVYLRDVFGRYITDENGNPVINPEYDENKTYIPREKRPEWDIVGLLGQVVVRQDGTLKAGKYIDCKNGIATYADSGKYRVLKIINNDVALILIK